ncbi:DinB family protein [Flaviflagellibacter deserti]|uniref:DinB family protein n=1 Tax=Flaviflagellibacter deserti TaxID=2267266 RepID=A0ABV9Z2L6_9HYPH
MADTMFSMLAGYNKWANNRLYDAAALVPDEEYRADRGAFFGSLHGTLNHLLVVDYIWMRRFTGRGSAPDELDVILHDDLAALRAAREVQDDVIISWVDSLTEADLTGMIRYRSISKPTDIAQPLAPALVHFFNHQTHHRGQAHALLTRFGGRDLAPSFDLILYQRESGVGLG